MVELSEPGKHARPVNWRTLVWFAIAFVAIAIVYHGLLNLIDLNAVDRDVGLPLLLYDVPGIAGLALMWPFGFWRRGTAWHWRIAAIVILGLVVVTVTAVHAMILFEICGFRPSCP